MHTTIKRFCLSIALAGLGSLLNGCGGGVSKEAPRMNCPSAIALGAGVDCVIQQLMASTGTTAATVTIMRDGVALYDKAYGYQDAAGKIALPANAMMVTASIVKPVTAAAVQQLAAAGTLKLSDHAFCTGQNAPCWLPASLLSAGSDARAGAITITELIVMSGGFDRASSGDPIMDEAAIQKKYGLTTAPQREDVIRYGMGRPLDFAPGTRYAYSNFSYLILAQIIEQASGMPYIAYVNSAIMAPIGIAGTEFVAMAALLKDRNPREPNYLATRTGASVYAPGTTVLWNDGFFNPNNWVSVGFAVTTSKAMATFAGKFQVGGPDFGGDTASGRLLNGIFVDGMWYGEWAGTQSVVRLRSSGVSYAVLLNKNSPNFDNAYGLAVRGSIDSVLSQLAM
jgi:CubicO group peptidase (beta-lactamase class C family)